MRRFCAVIVCLLAFGAALLGGGRIARADDAQNVATFNALIRAINRGDVTAALALFTDDAQLSGDAPFCTPNPCNGKAAIEKQFEFTVASHAQIQPLSSVQVLNGNIVVDLAVRVDPIRAAGFSRIVFRDTVTFRGDRIAKIVGVPQTSDAETAAFLAAAAAQPPASPASGRATSLAALHQMQLDALNRGDLAAVMSFFADDVRVSIGGCTASPCVGKAAVQAEVARQIAGHSRVTMISSGANDDSVVEAVLISGDQFTAAGIDRIRFLETVRFVGDKIADVSGQLDLTDAQTAAFVRAQSAQIIPPNTGDGGLR